MKTSVLLAIPMTVGLAFAQSQGGASGQTGSTGQPPAGSTAGQASGSQSGAKSGSGSGMAVEMKTMMYKGTLVDLACGSAPAGAGQADAKAATAAAGETGSTGSTGAAAGQAGTTGSAGAAAGQAGSTGSTGAAAQAAGAAGTANRSASDASSCPATANSTQLGLKMDDGKVVRFDLVGNQRAQDALKTNKGWNKNLTANKPLKVKISGVLQGDKLIVSSIN